MTTTISAPAKSQLTPRAVPPVLHTSHDGQVAPIAQNSIAVVGHHPDRAGDTKGLPRPNDVASRLLDPTLSLAADVVDDLERVRIANENRLRQLTRTGEDEDGEERGFGLPLDHPDVLRLQDLVTAMIGLEHQATLQLQRTMRRHPLGPWVKNTKGVGEKQAARLLAAIGDPYWNDLHQRPRTVAELWAYSGLHTLPANQPRSGSHTLGVGGAPTGGSLGHGLPEAHVWHAWVAARRKKGVRSNWSTAAKMRAWNVAVSCIKAGDSPYRAVYLARREATVERLHEHPCIRCGPAGKPAELFTPWSKGHQHADGLRIVSKAILKDLWIAARDIHQRPADQVLPETHRQPVGGS